MTNKPKKPFSPVAKNIMGTLFGLAVVVCFYRVVMEYHGVKEMTMASLIGSMATFFLHDACFPPGKIFGKWIPFLERHFRDNPKNPFGFLANPLGLCAYCQNIWVVLFTYTAMSFLLTMNWWLILPGLFLGHVFLNVLDKLFWSE